MAQKLTIQNQKAPFNPEKMPPIPDWMSDLAKRAGATDGVGDAKQKADRDAQWVAEWSDSLTVAIAFDRSTIQPPLDFVAPATEKLTVACPGCINQTIADFACKALLVVAGITIKTTFRVSLL